LGSHNREVFGRESAILTACKGGRERTAPTNIDWGRIDAVCKDGALSITLPEAEKTKAVKVEVKG